MPMYSFVNMKTGEVVSRLVRNISPEIGEIVRFEGEDCILLGDGAIGDSYVWFRRVWGNKGPAAHIDTSFRQ